ncbi:RagB/SusD family nutrient uptake outer membrane protein [Sphingobacterium faecale]|uniref:RagB/SusD family nutrient uptake outer membrane protein n=1 Tax=Sphingobacterium faecale TaxID=2803775 RepID=A0ABS1R5U6_9SPHI|nr:RagB/SusD family nutrient uptake outer membrane protein [Sphingobacterium faecale]MBL1410068.1 RagB/SusD family nutrient uptake outer membrane protein [Sphingobacterium faecale]
MKNLIYITVLLLSFTDCKRSDFLDEKPNQSNVVPKTLGDFDAILDRDIEMNALGITARGPVPGLGEAGSDNYYLLDADFNGRMSPQVQNYYTWAKDPYDGSGVNDWVFPYQVVFYANTVLDGLGAVERTDNNYTEFDRIRGSALFARAHAFYQLAQVFAPPYNETSAFKDWGIPLRLTAEVEEKISRGALKQTYDRIIEDLKTASDLLPELPAIKTRPSKQATYGLLARVYQTMQKYDDSQKYANLCLAINDDLLDYNTVNSALSYPFRGGSQNHKEVIFACKIVGDPLLSYPFRANIAFVPSDLYNLYLNGDLRKKVFFGTRSGLISYKGSYDGVAHSFGGIAIDEIYLIRAENNAREKKLDDALTDINTLLKSRWDKNIPFEPLSSNDEEEVLNIVLNERRKELIFRGLRWTDLRRLNLEGRNITLHRTVNGQEYTLLPNDPKYTYPTPNEVISFNPEMPQNNR